MNFVCKSCGQQHDLGEISFGADAPVQWNLISAEDQATSELGGEQCVIETRGERYLFVRACLDIPIAGTDRVFTWGVWVSLSESSFLEMSEHWENPSRTSLGPYFGWLCTKIPEYPDTVFLKTTVHQRAVGQRPRVELEQTEHQLSIDQHQGIESSRMQEIISKIIHT